MRLTSILRCTTKIAQKVSTNKPRTFSGIQPTGTLHLGNYFGAVDQWVKEIQSVNCHEEVCNVKRNCFYQYSYVISFPFEQVFLPVR